MNKSFDVSAICYIRQYADLDVKVSLISNVKITKIFDNQIKISVTFDIDDNSTAKRCCFYFTRTDTPPSPSNRWKYCGQHIFSNGSEAYLYVGLSDY